MKLKDAIALADRKYGYKTRYRVEYGYVDGFATPAHKLDTMRRYRRNNGDKEITT